MSIHQFTNASMINMFIFGHGVGMGRAGAVGSASDFGPRGP